jgi:RNA polymerase subunit RPABC4/transcription elongation factor Spt4
MNCKRCKRPFDEDELSCPHCGEANPDSTGLYQTSTVLISAGDSDLVYRSVEEIPVRLRTKLLKLTNGRNSATILIADRRGRREIAKAIRNLPGEAHRRLVAGSAPAPPAWLTPGRKKLILAVLVLLIAAFLAAVFLHRN